MPNLRPRDRARLPDRAFAYIDSTGQRRLPIHDAAHVRNALARFARVDFEDDAARDHARLRLLRAASRLGVAPIGFVAGQLDPQRTLPSGQVTFLMCDVEGSTELLAALGEGYGRLRADLRRLLRRAVQRADGREVDARADEYFAAFAQPLAALSSAVEAQQAIAGHAWSADRRPRLRMGIHTGRPSLTSGGYIGLAVHTVARVCAVGHGGQILVTRATIRSIGPGLPAGMELLSLGAHHLAGLADPVELIQAISRGAEREFPPLRLG